MPALRILAAVLAVALSAAAQTVSIQREGAGYKVVGWHAAAQEPPEGWPSVFALYAGEGDVPPMLGSYAVEHGGLIFRPKYGQWSQSKFGQLHGGEGNPADRGHEIGLSSGILQSA